MYIVQPFLNAHIFFELFFYKSHYMNRELIEVFKIRNSHFLLHLTHLKIPKLTFAQECILKEQ